MPTRDEMCKAMGAFYAGDADPFQDLTDDQVAQKYAAFKKFAAEAPGAGTPAPPAGPDQPPQWFSAWSQKYAADQEAMNQRLATVEKFASEVKPAVDQTAAFAAGFNQQVADQHRAEVVALVHSFADGSAYPDRRPRLEPADIDEAVQVGLSKSRTKNFAAGQSLTEFEAWKRRWLARAPLAYSAASVQDTGKPGAAPTPAIVSAAVRPGGVIDRLAPAVAERLRKAAPTN